MDFFKDTWNVLDEYFKSNYFLTKHHLDSYNDFILHKLSNTIQVLNPFIIIKNQGNITHEISVYIGGLEGNDIFIDKPTIIDNGVQKIMYPNEARLKNMTYKTDLYVNILIKYNTTEPGKEDIIETRLFKNVKIGAIPIMLHSSLCVLNNQEKNVLREMGECIYDQGGYFIIDGKEKVVVAQERITTNRIFINKSKDVKYSYEGLIRCTSEESPLFPKTINIYVYENKLKKNKINEDTGADGDGEDEDEDNEEEEEQQQKEEEGPGKITKFPNAIILVSPNIDIKIPLFVLFRALGVESDKDILEHIIGDDLEKEYNKVYIDFLRSSIIQCARMNIYTQEDAMNYLTNFIKYNDISKLKDIMINDLFPNVGHNFKNKALFLGHIIKKLVKICLNISKESDRDSYLFKRVDISGFLIGNIFRDYYNQFRQKVRNTIDNKYLYGPWREGLEPIKTLIQQKDIFTIFKSDIIENGIRKSLKGSWGVNMVDEVQDADSIKEGIVQDLSRVSYMSFMSHLRRVNTPMDPTSKIVAPHRLHTSQWGIMCPCESPDGASIGLLKNFAIMCLVTFDTKTAPIMELLKDNDLILLKDIDIRSYSSYTKILINSNLIGLHDDPYNLYKLLKLLKRNALINIYTSISWDIIQNEINILTEAGRCSRPVYVVSNGKLLIEKYIDKIKDGKLNWNQLITGFTLKDNVDIFSGKYIDPTTVIKDSNIIEQLELNQAPIEYIDVEEANYSYIAMDDSYLTKNKNYNYCEIHPSTIFGILTHQIALPNHNQAPRNIFSGAQGKQAIGCYATNFNDRIDTMSYLLKHPQRCLVNTRFCEYLNINNLPNGENLIVALMTYTGYNMEDAIIINEGSIQRGMFNVTYYKNIVDSEDKNKDNSEYIMFNNPKTIIDTGKDLKELKYANYSKLDDHGFPMINSYLSEGDAIIGKTKIKTELVEEGGLNNNIFGNVKKEIYYDRTMIADKTVSGVVDKVFLYDNSDNMKSCKIRLRKHRLPELGDKLCCYDDETEILTFNGWKFFKDLNKEDKVATLVDDSLVYQVPLELQQYNFNGKLYNVDSNQVKLRVTDNHRMYIRTENSKYDIKEAKDIYGKTVYYKKNVDNWKPDYTNAPLELIINDGEVVGFKLDNILLDNDMWLIFFGIWFNDGCILKEKYIIININDKNSYIKTVCKYLDFDYKIDNSYLIIENEELFKYLENNAYYLEIIGKSRTTYKYLPSWFAYLNQEQSRTLIYSMFLGEQIYYTNFTKLADQIQQLALHAGFSANKKLNRYSKWEVIMNIKNEPLVNKNDSWVDYDGVVYCCTVPKGNGVVYVRRKNFVVWSGNSRNAQKGTCGAIIPHHNMPFTKNGIVPDLIINPHGLPSRMTLAHMLETLLGKVGTHIGTTIDGTPFNQNSYDDLYKKLEDYGLEKHGNEMMYNGFTGTQMDCSIFIGPCYYERLKHMVADKINYRQVDLRTIHNHDSEVLLKNAPLAALTRQPTKGRGNNGGLRIGEMESGALISHGMAMFFKESLMERSDKFDYFIEDGQILDKDIADGWNISKLETPYAFKQFVQELKSMSIKPILSTEEILSDDD